jgi:hypothetical protein|tara:strand:- start:421 stop:546 length:126 start_codon:yes stop_codon:yes gene_type:complete
MKIEISESKKDHYYLTINKIRLGEFERSDLRNLIEKIDNQI